MLLVMFAKVVCWPEAAKQGRGASLGKGYELSIDGREQLLGAVLRWLRGRAESGRG
jgi:hypothetical protein